jgi:hypothetical protein
LESTFPILNFEKVRESNCVYSPIEKVDRLLHIIRINKQVLRKDVDAVDAALNQNLDSQHIRRVVESEMVHFTQLPPNSSHNNLTEQVFNLSDTILNSNESYFHHSSDCQSRINKPSYFELPNESFNKIIVMFDMLKSIFCCFLLTFDFQCIHSLLIKLIPATTLLDGILDSQEKHLLLNDFFSESKIVNKEALQLIIKIIFS